MLVAAEQEPPKQFMTLEKKHVPEYDPHSMRNYEAEYDPNSTILPLHRLPHHLQQVQ